MDNGTPDVHPVLGLANVTHIHSPWNEAEPLAFPELDLEFRSLLTNADGTFPTQTQTFQHPNKRGLSSLLELLFQQAELC